MTLLEFLERIGWFVTQVIKNLLFPGQTSSIVYTIPTIIMRSPILVLFALLPFVTLIIHIFWRLIKSI